MTEAFIYDHVRTPRGKGRPNGAFREITPIQLIAGYATAMARTPIVVKECPGFLVNRIRTPYMVGFLRAVYDGADYLTLDRVMERFGWPMGPAYLQDVIGMDTLLHVLHRISEAFPDRLRISIPHAVELLVQQRRLGQKNAPGFYRHNRDSKGRHQKEVDLGFPRHVGGPLKYADWLGLEHLVASCDAHARYTGLQRACEPQLSQVRRFTEMAMPS